MFEIAAGFILVGVLSSVSLFTQVGCMFLPLLAHPPCFLHQTLVCTKPFILAIPFLPQYWKIMTEAEAESSDHENLAGQEGAVEETEGQRGEDGLATPLLKANVTGGAEDVGGPHASAPSTASSLGLTAVAAVEAHQVGSGRRRSGPNFYYNTREGDFSPQVTMASLASLSTSFLCLVPRC